MCADKKLVNIKWFHPSSPVVNAAIFACELCCSSLCCSDETVWTPVKWSKVSPIRNVVVIQRQCSELVISSKRYERPETTCCHFMPSVCTQTGIYSLGKRKPFNMVKKKGEMTFLGQFASTWEHTLWGTEISQRFHPQSCSVILGILLFLEQPLHPQFVPFLLIEFSLDS